MSSTFWDRDLITLKEIKVIIELNVTHPEDMPVTKEDVYFYLSEEMADDNIQYEVLNNATS